MPLETRRILFLQQKTFLEGWKKVKEPSSLLGVMMMIKNLWYGRGHVDNLRPEIQEHEPATGKMLSEILLYYTGNQIDGCEIASVVGMEGEIEHTQTMAHTLRFGNQFREAIGTKSYIAISNTRRLASCALTIPFMDKHDGGQSSYYQTIQTSISDAPAADEIIIALVETLGVTPIIGSVTDMKIYVIWATRSIIPRVFECQ